MSEVVPAAGTSVWQSNGAAAVAVPQNRSWAYISAVLAALSSAAAQSASLFRVAHTHPAGPVSVVAAAAGLTLACIPAIAKGNRRALWLAALIAALSSGAGAAAGESRIAVLLLSASFILLVWREDFRGRSASWMSLPVLASVLLTSVIAFTFRSSGLAWQIVAFAFLGQGLFASVPYRWQVSAIERERAAAIATRYGRTGQDFFKTWPDKSLFFSPSGRSFISYRVAANCAVTLGDPVGPADDAESALQAFLDHCTAQGWHTAHHQVRPEYLSLYECAGLRTVKIGEDAYVELADFSFQGKAGKEFRNTVNKLERTGVTFEVWDAPVPDAVLDRMEVVSQEWLSLPGRRERRFTLGRFDRAYLRGTQVFIAASADGTALAFVNLAPGYSADEAWVDLMRRRNDAPNGVIDYLFTKTFRHLKDSGVARVNIGMAPLCGFELGPEAGWLERIMHAAAKRFDHVFSFRGLRAFKSKYATYWEPRYAAIRSTAALPRYALALRRVTEDL